MTAELWVLTSDEDDPSRQGHESPFHVGESSSPNGHSADAQLQDRAVTIEAFVARPSGDGQTALATRDGYGTILARHGLFLYVAKTGGGKTTSAIDFVLHAAAALDWCGLTFERPLRFLIVENEGPREAFRAKLEAKLATWTPTTDAAPVLIWDDDQRWGLAKLSDDTFLQDLRTAVEEHAIDFVVADTLTRFGVEGNGTPEETRKFVDRLTVAGLGRDVGFMLLHHPLTRPDWNLDELEQIAGAWAPHADLILSLRRLDGNRARLSYTKPRWARGQPPPAILAFDPDTETFTRVADEERDDDERVTPETYEQRILDYLADHPWAETEAVDKAGGRAGEARKARQRLAKAGQILAAPSPSLGLPGKGKRWKLATEAVSNPVPPPGTGQDEQPFHPCQKDGTPSHRPDIREGRGSGRGCGTGLANATADDEVERLEARQEEFGL